MIENGNIFDERLNEIEHSVDELNKLVRSVDSAPWYFEQRVIEIQNIVDAMQTRLNIFIGGLTNEKKESIGQILENYINEKTISNEELKKKIIKVENELKRTNLLIEKILNNKV